MHSQNLRAAAPLFLALALVAAGCGSGSKTPTSSAHSSSSPSPSASPSDTVTLKGDTAAVLGAPDGTKATVVPDPADAPGATDASQPPTAPRPEDAYVEKLADDTGLDIDPSTAPDMQWVTVKSRDETLSIDVPADWQYFAYGPPGDQATGAVGPTMANPEQFVTVGDRSDTIDDEMTSISRSPVANGCKAGPIRPYEDGRFTGQGRSFACGNGTSETYFVVDGKGENSSFKGSFFFKVKDAVGVAAIKRAVESFELS